MPSSFSAGWGTEKPAGPKGVSWNPDKGTGPFGVFTLLPQGVQDVMNYNLEQPVRRAIDPVMPDLELRIEDQRKSMKIASKLQGSSFSAPAPDAAKEIVLGKSKSGELHQNYLTGLVSTALSSLPEFFGMAKPVETEVFEINNPWTAFAAGLVGPGGAYAAAFKFSKLGKIAPVLEKATERGLGFFGTTAAKSPVWGGVMREAVRYTPLELSRLGVGFTVWPDNTDNLLGNVAMDMAMNSAVGALGGVLSKEGSKRAVRAIASVIKKDIGLHPAFELRLMKEAAAMPDALQRFSPDVEDIGGLINGKATEALGLAPGKVKGVKSPMLAADMKAEKYFYDLGDGVDKEGAALLEKMLTPNGSKLSGEALEQAGLDVRFMQGGKVSETHKIPKDVLPMALKSLGLEDATDLAANVVFPRAAKITTARMAGQMAKTFEGQTGLQVFADDGVMAVQDGEGLWVFAKRIGERGAKMEPDALDFMQSFKNDIKDISAKIAGKADDELVKVNIDGTNETVAYWKSKVAEYTQRVVEAGKPKAGKAYGPLGFKEGDLFLTGKTDRLDLILPKHHEGMTNTIKDWAQMTAKYRPGLSDDFASQEMDAVLEAFSWKDWAALKSGTRAAGVARIMQRVKKKVLETGGLADSGGLQTYAEHLYDIAVPTARKELSSPTYQKLYFQLQAVNQKADHLVNLIMRGKSRFKGSVIAGVRSAKNMAHDRHWEDLESPASAISKLTDEEAEAIMAVGQAAPKDMAAALEAFSENGLVSDNAKSAIAVLAETNKRMLDQYVRPALKTAGIDDEIKWLDNYTTTKTFDGDYFVDVKSGNRTLHRVVGSSKAEVERWANGILEQAASEGKNWKFGDVKVFEQIGKDDVSLEKLFQSSAGATPDKDVALTVLNGMKRAMRNSPGIPKVRKPGVLANERGDLDVITARSRGKDELLKNVENHAKTLLRFAGNRVYTQRWGPELLAWKEDGNRIMAEDLERKATQYLGIQGEHAKAQDRLLGQALGGKARTATQLASMSNGFMYQMTLGVFNTSFALLNVLTPLMTTAPWISYMTKAPTADMLRHMQVMPRLDAAGKEIGTASSLYPIKVMGAAVRMMKSPTAQEKEMIGRAIDDHVLSAQIYDTAVGGPESEIGQSLRESWHKGGAWDLFKGIAGSAALKSEQFSRLIAFNAAVTVGRDFFQLGDDALYRFAKKATERTMYGYGVTDRARIMTAPLGSVTGLFKNWQAHYISQMVDYVGLAGKGGSTAPLMYMLGSTLAIGGLGATPLRGVMDGMADAFTESDSSFKWLQQNWGGHLADGVYFGLPGFLGFSLQSSTVMPGTDMVQDLTNLSNIVVLKRAQEMAQVVGKMREYGAATGQSALSDKNLRAELVGVMMPRSMSRLYSITEDDAILSMKSGYPTARGVSATTKMLYGLGLNQVDVERYQVAGRELFNKQEEERALLTTFGMEYAQAQAEENTERMKRVMDKSMMLGIDQSRVRKSAMTRTRREQGDALTRYDAQDVRDYNLEDNAL